MEFRPGLEEVKTIAAKGEYSVLPVSCELLSDFTTPIEAMRVLKKVSDHCYMLESAQANETWGRYTFLGYDPKMEINIKDGELFAEGKGIGNGSEVFKEEIHTENPSDYIRKVLAGYKSPRFDYLPTFTGGLVGYFGFDYLGYSEPATRVKVIDSDAFKDMDVMLFDKVIAFDHVRQKIILMANMKLNDAEANYEKAKEELAQTEVHAEAGGGLVKVTMTCRNVVKRIEIDPELLQDDADMIEDLIAAAMNDASRQAEVISEEKLKSANSGMGLPPGLSGLF